MKIQCPDLTRRWSHIKKVPEGIKNVTLFEGIVKLRELSDFSIDNYTRVGIINTMTRLVFSKEDLTKFFEEAKRRSGLTWGDISKLLGVSERNFFDWRKGHLTVPEDVVFCLEEKFDIKAPKPIKKLKEDWSKSSSGRLGSIKSRALHGNPGTSDGRKKGGLRAVETHRNRGTNFFTAREVIYPKYSEELAEFVGIILGDGGISDKQIYITLHIRDDIEYANHVRKIIIHLFKLNPSVWKRVNRTVVVVGISRVKIVKFFLDMGFCIGDKVRQQVSVPEWIKSEKKYIKACLRGLFDTDGCFFIDKHKYKNKIYKSGGMNFTNRSIPLLNFFMSELECLGLHPTQGTKYSIFLRRKIDILSYFDTIGTANPKHQRKFDSFYKRNLGEVPKRS